MKNLSMGRSASLSVLAFAIAVAGQSSTAWAQNGPAPAPQTDTTASGEEIVVTGSRLARAGYDAPTPVNVVGDERMKQLGIPNVGDALNQIPSFRAINTPANNSFRVSGNIGGRTMDLRGLGATRTLTLVDGRRFVASSDNGTVDLNGIPSIMVKRAEVVTGGASAAYGANAVAGVVNLILDTKLNGIKTDMNFGISQRGDAKNFYAAGAFGTDFGGGRGHVVVGAEYQKDYGVGPCEVRASCLKYTNYIQNPGYDTVARRSTNGLPATLVLDNVMFTYNENGILSGAVTSTGKTLGQQVLNTPASGTYLPNPLRGKQFDANGNLVPYQFGNYLSGLFQQIRDTTQPFNLGWGSQPTVVPTWHTAAMAHMDYDLTDTITASTEFMFSHTEGTTQSAPPLDGPATLDINNPFISNATRATILAADPTITKLLVDSSSYALGSSNISTTKINTYRGMIGFKGKLFEGWDWDSYYTYGQVNARLDDQNNRLKGWNDAWDVIGAPAGNALGVPVGTPVCRIAVAPPAGRQIDTTCIPINLLGYNQINPAAVAKYIVPEWQTRTFKQHAAAINLRGAPFQTWAGDVKIAVGGEWRRDTAVGTADTNTLTNNFISPQATPLPFTRTTVLEGYGEVSVPLLKDSPMGKQLDVDGAVRRSHYTPFGNAWTWKVGLVYAPIQDISFRVTKSRDVRAPTAQESSPNSTSVLLPLPDPFTGGTHNQNIVTGGNPNLKLERGDTFTAGVVLKPSFVPRFNLSLDYYNIHVKGAIDSLTGSAIATACKNQGLLCDLITFNSDGSINTVFSNFQNLSQLHAEGFELVADYSLPVLGGNLAFQVNGNYIVDLSTIGGTGLVTQLDDWTGNQGSISNIQGVPRWKLDGVVTYSRNTWSLTAHGRYIPRGLLDPTKIGAEQAGYDINNPNSATLNHVSSRFYLDLSGSFKVASTRGDGKVEMYWQVSNVFDKGEPKQLRLVGNPLQFDPVLRAFRVGVRTTW